MAREWLNEKVLVLNQSYQPISISTAGRAFLLLYLHKAEIITTKENRIIRSVSQVFPFPSIIRLNAYITIPYRKVSLSRNNIFRRDSFKCCYCYSTQDLTVDHLIPRSLGGGDSWENLVTACQKCNAKKANQRIENTDLVLRQHPFRPSFILYLRNFSGTIPDEWRPYLMMS
ncbi:MAG: HNH endonuclease [Bacteroidia bacterium]|nr:HNH endonuclease [Bacteroidia bacterium]